MQRTFPQLVIEHLRPLGSGWDSAVFLVNDTLVIRVPKRLEVAKQMEMEIRLLASIQHQLNVQIPNASHVGLAKEGFIHAMGYPQITGVPFNQLSNPTERERFYPRIAEFLTQLHTIPISSLPPEILWFRWTGDALDISSHGWAEGLRRFCDRVAANILPLLSDDLQRNVAKEIGSFFSRFENFTCNPTLLHGDFSEEHVLVDPGTGFVTGVIDFGDSGLGDPAYDVWPSLNRFYPMSTDPTFLDRQRFYRRLSSFHGALFGLLHGDEKQTRTSLQEIERTFA